MNKTYETIKVEEPFPGILLVTLNRPEVSNAFNTQTGHELYDVFHPLELEHRKYRCVIITGAGDKAFCAGGDLKERKTLTEEQWVLQHELFERTFRSILNCPLPILAAVNGHAFGGGFELMLQCDFAYASRNARFALTEVSLGIMPGGAGTQTLPRAVGERRAKEIILTASPFSADEACEWGVVNRVFEPDEVLARTLEAAQKIAANAPLSIRQAKHSIHYGLQMDLNSGMMFELETYQRMVHSQDRKEGILAFNEKRKPNFKGW
ncbi:enoyl-CoA hydratase/isomerase family protein [Advenella sp. WQ 585]|uniref:Enoyl-CoA hydratase/isomerase family protein n=1 Tax=Advenella mandrilli TaxID=2800330 RepID=A0ABS1EFY6_9BURK|nr:enoyl-CoA hydratase-related protein [Advenella mandrilli]MBK1781090.1 enoyl-CoA hydratase/isomerase family protein [Advenella mandrilli]